MVKKLKQQRSNQLGFSLIEAMIGLVIFAIGILAVAQFTSGNMHDSSGAHVHSAAMQYLSQRIEPLMRAGQFDSEPGSQLGPQTIVNSLGTLNKTANPQVIGDIGMTLNSAVDGNGVNLVGFRQANFPNVVLRAPYMLVVTMSYINEAGDLVSWAPVTRVITTW